MVTNKQLESLGFRTRKGYGDKLLILEYEDYIIVKAKNRLYFIEAIEGKFGNYPHGGFWYSSLKDYLYNRDRFHNIVGDNSEYIVTLDNLKLSVIKSILSIDQDAQH